MWIWWGNRKPLTNTQKYRKCFLFLILIIIEWAKNYFRRRRRRRSALCLTVHSLSVRLFDFIEFLGPPTAEPNRRKCENLFYERSKYRNQMFSIDTTHIQTHPHWWNFILWFGANGMPPHSPSQMKIAILAASVCACVQWTVESRNLCQCKSNQIKREMEGGSGRGRNERCIAVNGQRKFTSTSSPSFGTKTTTATTWWWWIYTHETNSLLVITVQKRTEIEIQI